MLARMSIASFCRDELLAYGPLTADDLGERAAAAGVTRAASPRNAVLSAMRGREVELSDGRWVSPLYVLEGRCLTTPLLPLMTSDVPHDSNEEDLALLHRAARLRPIPLVGGGYLRHYGYNRWWKSSARLPEAASDELLCLRVTNGELAISTVHDSELATPDRAVVGKLDDATGPRRNWYDDATTAVVTRLAELILADPSLMRQPGPPLSRQVGALRRVVERREEQRLRSRCWLPEDSWQFQGLTLHLSDDHALRLDRLAALDGLLPYEWVERQIDRVALNALQPQLRLVP